MRYSEDFDIILPDWENLHRFIESCFCFPALIEMLEMCRKQRDKLDPVELEILRKAASWLFAEFKSTEQEKKHAETMSILIANIQPNMKKVMSDPLAQKLLTERHPGITGFLIRLRF